MRTHTATALPGVRKHHRIKLTTFCALRAQQAWGKGHKVKPCMAICIFWPMDISMGRLGSFALMHFSGATDPHNSLVASEPPNLEEMTCRGYKGEHE